MAIALFPSLRKCLKEGRCPFVSVTYIENMLKCILLQNFCSMILSSSSAGRLAMWWAAKYSWIEKCRKLNVVAVPVRPRCSTACRRPKPLMAPGIAVISGQAALISSELNINLSSLRASSDNFDSCWIILLYGSGRSVSFGNLVNSVMLPWRGWRCVWQDVGRQ